MDPVPCERVTSNVLLSAVRMVSTPLALYAISEVTPIDVLAVTCAPNWEARESGMTEVEDSLTVWGSPD
jgi:hypothetical protein